MFGKLGYQHEEKNDWNQFEDILGNLQKFIVQGKIRYIGLSNETPWGVSKCLELAKYNILPRMMSIQNPYSLLNRTFEVGLAEIAIREQIGLLAYSPLASDTSRENIETIKDLLMQELLWIQVFGEDMKSQIQLQQ